MTWQVSVFGLKLLSRADQPKAQLVFQGQALLGHAG